MKIKTSSFCAISRSQDWNVWLRETAADLHNELQATLNSHKGCKANSEKMVDIYNALYQRGLGVKFEEFIQRRFPYIIEGQTRVSTLPKTPQPAVTSIPAVQSVSKPIVAYMPADYTAMNKHKVFRAFRPDVLSFPQKHIIVGDPQQLMGLVQEFVKDKVGIDYIIVEDRAYIEYFDNRHADVVSKIPRHSREIYAYRQRVNGLPQPNPGKPPA